ncbi:hypothetical protein [Pseudomonas azotoformans]|uniref:PAAR domain-containing protein n=1 Tax=Pseudomonas azotoformans TaxID=47878 RepID=A0A127HY14_PSEAZ|nr:hypothetical protein [Pseudomonas azotoformans]AMN79405.1 hypothetical protein AYR47_14195 [Pseudomonas azotoformans]
MNTPRPSPYTNDASSELLRNLDKPRFTEEQLATFNKQALEIVNQQQTYLNAHPAIAIYRIATQGSQTRDGGVIKQATFPVELKLTDGSHVRAAQKGDYVVYPDGTQSQVVTTAGKANSNIALVGSRLSNGDLIINTPQDSTLLIAREGVPLAQDFLPTTAR